MTSQRNEPFDPDVNSSDFSSKLGFKKAQKEHIQDVFEIMSHRNPGMEREQLLKKVTMEITELNDGIKYGVFVALLDLKVVGFCRFYHSNQVPPEKVKFKNPDGMCLMGILVDPNFRRQGIARFLSERRLGVLHSLSIEEAYSAVAVDNPTSLRMHKSFGFEEIERGKGFLNVMFDCGEGILFKKRVLI